VKITERILIDMCRRINIEQLKSWDSGLKIERRAEKYVVLRLFRKTQEGRPGSLDLFRGSPREVEAFIDGFANAAELANNGAAGETKTCTE
jgi:hypothetical protein